MKFRTLAALTAITSAALLAAHSANAAVVLVDNFTEIGAPGATFSLPPSETSPQSQVTTGLASVYGGSRTITLGQAAPASSGELGTGIVTVMPDNSLEYQSPDNRDGTVALTYNLAGLGVSAADFQGILVSFVSYDQATLGSINLSLTASFTGSGDSTSAPIAYSLAGANTILIPSTGIVGLGSVTNLTITFDPPTAGDFVINSLSAQVVPEPSALAFVMPLTLVALRRRR